MYGQPTTAIAHIVNCIAVRPYGLSEVLAKKYPYADTYKTRKAIGTMNRAHVSSRPAPGTIQVCRPPHDSHGPLVVNLFGEFYMGKSVDVNNMSKKLLSKLRNEKADGLNRKGGNTNQGAVFTEEFDSHLLDGIESDTTENRTKWFQQCLRQLEEAIPKENIRRVVFPFKIGCGLAGGNWERDYQPSLVEFNESVTGSSKNGVEVIIVKKVEKKESEQALAPAGTHTLPSKPSFRQSRQPKFQRR